MEILRLSLKFIWVITAATLICLGLSWVVDLPLGIVNLGKAAKFILPLSLLLTLIYSLEKRRRLDTTR